MRFEIGDERGSYNFCDIKIEDLELVKVGWITDEDLKEEILDNRWWCKVEDGYITNLNGERENKIPYDYDS